MTENGRVCVVCGKALTGKQERYCSKRCKKKAEHNRARGEQPDAKYTKVCPTCGHTFLTDKKNRKFCGEECAKEWNRNRTRNAQSKRAEKPVIICAVCGKKFEGNSAQAKYCSKECRAAAWVKYRREKRAAMRETLEGRERQEKTPQEPMTKTCAICGNEFETRSHWTKYCSDKCRSKAVVLGAKRYRERLLATPEGRAIDAQRRKKYAETQREKQGRKKRQSAKDKIKKCAHCGKEFTGRGGSKFCSDECRKAVINQERAAEKSKLNGRFCKVCGKALTGRQRTVCSKECEGRRHAEKAQQTAIKPQKAAMESVSNERICKVCGKPLSGRQKRYCSEECRMKAASIWALENYKPVRGKQGLYREQICIDCGKPYYGHIRQKRCRECREEHKRRLHQESERRRKLGKTRKIGSTDICEMCGKPYIVMSGMQRYCKKCAPIAVAENIRSKARERTAEYYKDETHREEKAEARRVKVFDIKSCDICGLVFVPHGNQEYCSKECADEALKRWNRTYYDKKRARKEKKEVIFRECAICGKEFVISNPNERYCSDACRKEGRKAIDKAANEAKKQARKAILKTCPICNKEFEVSEQHRRYCSDACSKEAIRIHAKQYKENRKQGMKA